MAEGSRQQGGTCVQVVCCWRRISPSDWSEMLAVYTSARALLARGDSSATSTTVVQLCSSLMPVSKE